MRQTTLTSQAAAFSEGCREIQDDSLHASGEWSLSSLFERQVRRNPGAIALEFEQASLTYAALNSRVNRLARSLMDSGIGPEDIIAVALPRSLDLIVALLGILKSGAAYLPLDSQYPSDRLAFMIDDARPKRIVTSSAIAPLLPKNVPILYLDDADTIAALALQRESNPSEEGRRAALAPLNRAYVIYTSGSTGRPKGVMVTHAGIANLAISQIERFAITAESRVLQFASVSFDAAVSEISTSLLAGARLILAPASQLLPGEALSALIARSHATHATLPPSALAILAPDALPKGFTLIVAGEACPPHLVERWSTGRRMINAYGPTEATVCATITEPLSGAIAPPLGEPIPNVGVFVLDEYFEPVPAGAPGEIFIAGIGLARGYLGRADLTAERFLPNPFGPSGSRMYGTGDLARWRDDGALEFLGRTDHQVKIRGFRVEPGEIEAVLARHPAVSAVAIVAREDSQGQQQLIGYAVPMVGESVDAAALRRYVAELLPEYMVPAAMVLLERLPLTPNGKLDRNALPHPTFSSNRTAPNTPQEVLVAQLFAEVLGLDEFGMEDSFFDLGGHSLAATRLISRIRATSGAMLELDDVFDQPTVAGLAARLEMTAKHKSALPGIVRVARSEYMPLSFSQQRLWFLDQLEPGSPFYNMPGAVGLVGPLNVDTLQRTLNEIVRRHETLRTRFAVIDDAPVQVIAATLTIDLPVSDLSNLTPAERDSTALRLTEEEKKTPFDLSSGPLIRARLIRLEEQRHTLLVTLQHTVGDGWSMGLLVNEVAALYGAFVKGLRSPLTELGIQYADYSHWQQRWLSGEVLERQLEYWNQVLAGSPALLDLPTDRPRTSVQSSRASAHLGCFLPSALTLPLQKLAGENNATLFMALLTILDIVLLRWTGQSDLVVGTVVAGRTNSAVEPLIGCFVNFLPLRVQCSPQDSTNDLMKRLATTVREAYAHQDAPFEKITETVNPKRGFNHNPIFNVGFLLQNFPEARASNDDLSIEMLPVTQDTATLDLRFVAQESSDGIHLACEYRTDLYVPETIIEVLDSFRAALEHCVEQPDAPVGKMPFSRTLTRQNEARAAAARPSQHVVIAATFTAEPLRDALEFWCKQLGIEGEIEFAPYNQVFQMLLDPRSPFANNRAGANFVLLRLEDWIRDVGDEAPHEERFARLRQHSADLLAAIDTCAGRGGAPLLLCFCPLSAALQAMPGYLPLFDNLQRELLLELRDKPGVHALGTSELQRFYPVVHWEDEHADNVGHIPYSTEFYVALATLLMRKLLALRARPYKVIVLDCDNTLWEGVCGEVGAQGVRITPAHEALQRFMLAQSDAGMLLCLASKNNADDVDAVFAHHPDMPLNAGHFVASRINWRPKSQSIRELAEELQLGLDSFVLLDDNPVECAEVLANCPGALVLRLPQQTELIALFLDHVWAFDRAVVTADARRRTRQYQENSLRETLRAGTSSFAEFLASLKLQVSIGALQSTQLERAAELTQRTNQFNLRPQPRHAGEIKSLGNACLGVQVIDRFGEYGLTGVIGYEVHGDALSVDTFLLSCRILGRGVEHQVVAHLGRIAEEAGCSSIALPYTATGKNEPILSFLEAVAGPAVEETPLCFTIPVGTARHLQPAQPAEHGAALRAPNISRGDGETVLDSPTTQLIAETLNSVRRITQRVAESTPRVSRIEHEYRAPESLTERELASIWGRILHRDAIGTRDDFFALGGHSLLAAQVVSQIRTAFRIDLQLRAMFETPTIESLAAVVDEAQLQELEQFDEAALQEMLAGMSGEDDRI
jgi:amino acid adenylation domain-containing protein/FkbH-like protein